jgi:hypothetical protein
VVAYLMLPHCGLVLKFAPARLFCGYIPISNLGPLEKGARHSCLVTVSYDVRVGWNVSLRLQPAVSIVPEPWLSPSSLCNSVLYGLPYFIQVRHFTTLPSLSADMNSYLM